MAKQTTLRRRATLVVALALLINLVAVSGALLLADIGAVALGVGAIAYLLGVRHAFDVDHVAVIDNVTRRLRAQGQRPAAVGLFFSLGHSTVVLVLTAAAIAAARSFGDALPSLMAWGGLVGKLVSAGFLTVIGIANLRVLAGVLRRRSLDDRAGPMRGLDRLTRATDRSWKMFPLGMLFGLSFDTASEVALLALSIAAAHGAGAPVWAALLLPLMFTAGMALMDTGESLLMLGLYEWAIADHDRTLRLNSAVTTISVLLALGVASVQWAGLMLRPGELAAVLPVIDDSSTGLLATGLLLGIGAVAWLKRQRGVALQR